MARRAGIFKRQDGRWASCPTIGGQRRWYYGRTAQDVQDQVDEAKHLAKRGRIVIGTQQTVEQFLEEWLTGMQPPIVRPTTHTMYGVHIRRALPAIGAIRLTKLTSRHLRLCYAELNKTHAPRTIQVMNAVLHQAFEQAVEWDLLVRNPTNGVKLQKVARGERQTLTREQVRILLDGTIGTRWHAFMALMCATGLRISEGAGLTWSDLEESVPSINVHQQFTRRNGEGLVFGPLKTDSSYRKIKLPPGVVRTLKAHRALQAEQRLKVGAEWDDHNLIFPTLHGRPNDPAWIRAAFYQILEELELPRITPHQLRHTAATLMAEEDKHPKIVQMMLGHRSSAPTLDIYSHVTPRLEQELADAMEELLFGS